MGALRTIVNKLFLENFNTTLMRNIKIKIKIVKKILAFFFSYKTFPKIIGHSLM